MLENPITIAVPSPRGGCQLIDDVVVQLGQPWRGHIRQFQETEDGFEGVLSLGCGDIPVRLSRNTQQGDIVIKAEPTGKVGQRFSGTGGLFRVNPYNEYDSSTHQSVVRLVTGSINHYLEQLARQRSYQPKQLTTA
jgi:hypothetical protein